MPDADPALKAYAAELRTRVDAAFEEVAAAEAALEKALAELKSGTRADKVNISSTLELAFARLRAGRTELARLRALVPRD